MEFDVTAYRASDLHNEYVACEVKKTVAESYRFSRRFTIAYPAIPSSKSDATGSCSTGQPTISSGHTPRPSTTFVALRS